MRQFTNSGDAATFVSSSTAISSSLFVSLPDFVLGERRRRKGSRRGGGRCMVVLQGKDSTFKWDFYRATIWDFYLVNQCTFTLVPGIIMFQLRIWSCLSNRSFHQILPQNPARPICGFIVLSSRVGRRTIEAFEGRCAVRPSVNGNNSLFTHFPSSFLSSGQSPGGFPRLSLTAGTTITRVG